MDRWRVSLFGDRLHVITDDDVGAGERDTIAEACRRTAFRCVDVREEAFSLEDVFIGVVEKARQQGKVARDEE